MGYKGMSSPVENKLDNPLKNGSRYRKAKANRDKALSKTGVKLPRSPLS